MAVKRLLIVCALLASGGAFAQGTEDPDDAPPPVAATPDASPVASAWPDDPQVAPARAAYNSKRFDDAVTAFTQLAQTHPGNAMVYLGLARSSAMAGDAIRAVTAYRFFLGLSTDAALKEKAQAELENQAKKAEQTGDAKAPGQALMDGARAAAKAGQFDGEKGAPALLKAALAAGFVSPQLDALRTEIDGQLTALTEAAIADWWAPEKQLSAVRLSALASSYSQKAEQGELAAEPARLRSAVSGLIALFDGDNKAAVDTLGRGAAGDFRLRYAQALALYRSGRFREARDLLSDLSARQEDPRFAILLGWVQARLGQKKKAGATLQSALLQ